MSDFWLWDDHERDHRNHDGDHHDHEDRGHDHVRWLLDDLLHTRRVQALFHVAHDFIGHEAYAAGFYYGLGLAAAEAATGMAALARTFVLADVYEVLFKDSAKAHVVRSLNYGTVKLAARLIGRDSGIYHRLEAEYEHRQTLIAEVRNFLKWDALRSLPANLRAEYHEKWKRIEALNARTDVADRFEAGKYFGQVVGELVLTIGGLLELGVVTIELAARAPTLVRLARGVLKNAADDAPRLARVPVGAPEPFGAPKPAAATAIEAPKPVEPALQAPPLTKADGRTMLREAVGNLKTMPPEVRETQFRSYRSEISTATNGQWSAKHWPMTKNGSVYAGEGGEALVFDDAGNMYRGHLQDSAAFAREPGGLLIDYSKLKPL